MDRNQLEISLQPFRDACLNKTRPLSEICVSEAYPGDSSTSYIIQVKAPWVEATDCSEALDFLFETLWETVGENTRRYIFSIEILDNEDRLHCSQPALAEKDAAKM